MKQILLIACLLTASPAWASTYWVSKSGSNGNGCTDSPTVLTTTAKLTIAAGIACLSPGDTLQIGAGVYVESFSTGLPSGTNTTTGLITIRAYDLNDKPIIQPNTNNDAFLITSDNYVTYIGLKIDMVNETVNDGAGSGVKIDVGSSYITWEDCQIDNVAGGSGTVQTMPIQTSGSVTNPSHITFRRCIIDRTGDAVDSNSHCAYLNGVDDLLFENNEVLNCGGYGIMVYEANGLTTDSSNNIIRNNIVHGTGSGVGDGRWGIMVSGTQNCQIYNNIIYNNYGGINIGASTGEDVDGCIVYHNTVYNNMNSDGNPAGIWVRSGSTSTIIYNNISYLNSPANCTNNGTGTTGVTSGTCANSNGGNLFGINPSFTSAGTGDFTIPSTSAARNMGVGTATTGILTDIIGTSREANPDAANPDAGAYEFIYDPPDPPDPPDPGQPSGRTSFRRR